MRIRLQKFIALLACLFSSSDVLGFVPQRHIGTKAIFNVNTFHQKKTLLDTTINAPPVLIQNQRKSCASVQTMSLFGLGGPEIAVILIAVFFVLGPQKLAEIGRNAGKAASDFRDVPKEFQKGLEEGEIESRSRSAKPMDSVDKNTSNDINEEK